MTPDSGCKCDHEERALGVQDGINMGRGIVRIGTHPRCPVHALCQHYTTEVRTQRSNGSWLWCPVHAKQDCP